MLKSSWKRICRQIRDKNVPLFTSNISKTVKQVLWLCSSEKMTPIYFLRLSKVLSMLHHGSVWRVHKKTLLKNFYVLFWHIFVVFHHKICAFIIFISFSDEVSNFRNRILTNQKRELVVSNCQRNCMLWPANLKTFLAAQSTYRHHVKENTLILWKMSLKYNYYIYIP